MSLQFILAAGLVSDNKKDQKCAEALLGDILRVHPLFPVPEKMAHNFDRPLLHYEQWDRILHDLNNVAYAAGCVPDFDRVKTSDSFCPKYCLTFSQEQDGRTRQMISVFRCINGLLSPVTFVLGRVPFQRHVSIDELLRDHPFAMTHVCVRELGFKGATELLEKTHPGVLTVKRLKRMRKNLQTHSVHAGGCVYQARCALCETLGIPPGGNVVTHIRAKITETYGPALL